MSIIEAGLSRLPIRLNTFERVQQDIDLRCIYTGQSETTSLYHLVPKQQAPQLRGSAIKSVYNKQSTFSQNQKVADLWIGKMGIAKSLERPERPGDSRPWEAYNEGDMNEEVVKEKIGCDAYRLFGDGFFATPKTRLSRQPIRDPYTQDEVQIRVYTREEPLVTFSREKGAQILTLPRAITHSLRVMSKWVKGYRNLEDIQVPHHPDHPTESLTFMGYIEKYGRPAEQVIDPTGHAIPLYGVMAVLAAATSIGDIDVLGGSGANCGLIFLRSLEGKVNGALVIKIDPGYVFSYNLARDQESSVGNKDIRYSTSGGLIHWDSLTTGQKQEFLEVKRNALALNRQEILDYLCNREGRLWENGIQRPQRFDEVTTQYKTSLQIHLADEAQLYEKDLREYEGHREEILRCKGKEAYEAGIYDRAFNYAEKMVELQESQQPVDKIALANSYYNLGMIYDSYGSYDRSVKEYQKSLTLRRDAIAGNPSQIELYNYGTACCHERLGLAFLSQKKYAQAIQDLSQALNLRLAHFGSSEHPVLTDNYYYLWIAYRKQRKYEEAVEYFKQYLAKIRRAEETAKEGHNGLSGNGFAMTFDSWGNPHMAIMDPFGNYNRTPRYMADMQNRIGEFFVFTCQYDQAIPLYQKALQIRLEACGENHPDVAESYTNLWEVYTSKKDYGQAFTYLNKALLLRRTIFGEEHIEMAKNYHDLGKTFLLHEKYEEAIGYYQQALKIRQNVFNENHLQVADSYYDLGTAYASQKKHDLAESFFEKALQIQLRTLGADHPDVAMTYDSFAKSLAEQKKYEQAIVNYKSALEIRLSLFGDHPDVAQSFNNLMSVYYLQRNYDQVFVCLQNELDMTVHSFKTENNPKVAFIYNNFGMAYFELENYEQAADYFQRALRIRQATLGEQRPETAIGYHNLANAYFGMAKYPQALEYNQKAHQIRRVIFGEDHPDVVTSLRNIEDCKRRMIQNLLPRGTPASPPARQTPLRPHAAVSRGTLASPLVEQTPLLPRSNPSQSCPCVIA